MSSHDPRYQLTQPGTPTTATSLPGDPTMNHPCYPTPGNSTGIILNHQNASANMTDSWTTISSLNQQYQQPMQPRAPATIANMLNDPPQNLPGYLTPRIDTERVLSHQTTSVNVTNSWTIANSLDRPYQLMQLRSPNVTDSWTTESFLHPPYQPTYQRTSTAASLLGASAQNNLGHRTPGTSTKSVLCQQRTSSNVTDSCHVLNARTTMSYLDAQCEPTQPRTPATAFSHLNDPAINSRSYSTLVTGTGGILGDQKISANATDSWTTASFVTPSYKPTQSSNPARTASLLGDSSHDHSCYLAPRTSTKIIRGHQKTSMNMIDSCARTNSSPLDPSYQPTQTRTPVSTNNRLGDLAPNHPAYPSSGSGTKSILSLQKTSKNMFDSWDTMTSCDPPHRPRSPRTPSAAADMHDNLLPPHTRNQTRAGIILCLPAQQTLAKTSNSQPIPTTRPPKNLTSTSQISDGLTLKHESKSASFWTLCHRCRMRYQYMEIFLNKQLMCPKCNLPFMAIKMPAPSAGVLESLSDDALPQNITSFTGNVDAAPVFNAGTSGLGEGATKKRSGSKRPVNSVGNRPRSVKELPREKIRQMLMDKARVEITRYLENLTIAESSGPNMEKMEE